MPNDRTFVFDPESNTPSAVQERQFDLVTAARSCYALRDAAIRHGAMSHASDLLDIGDIYFARALALGAEWEAPLTPDVPGQLGL